MFYRYSTSLWVLVFLLVGCSGLQDTVRTPLIGFGDLEGEYHFENSQSSWDTFQLPEEAASFTVSDGALVGSVVGDRGYIWSLNQPLYADISIKAKLQQIRGSQGNGFGVMCRADESGNGYYFVVSSTGQFAILKAVATVPDPIQLVKWQSSGAVQTGEDVNAIEAICVGDYLSFTVNGVFIAEARDSEFKTGHVGAVLGAVKQPLWVRFDDIIIRDVRVIGG